MEYRRLGKSGLKLGVFSFGSWVTFSSQLDDKLAENCMTLAYERGVNFFDNAEVYAKGESERIMGQVLKNVAWPRDTYCVSSKVFWGGEAPTQLGLSAKHVTEACHAALKRLQVDYLDMYFCHRPDPETPVEETVRAMHALVQQGKIIYWGTSEWPAEKIEEAYQVAEKLNLTPPTMEQPQYNLFHRERLEREYAGVIGKYGMGTTIWSPLASGLLTGKYNDGIPAGSRMTLGGYEFLRDRFDSEEGKVRLAKVKKLSLFAKELGVPLAQLAIAWCAKKPNVSTVILGASRREQLAENLKALEIMPQLTPEVLSHMEKLTE